MATRGADVSILRSTARSIGCEGKRVKDSATFQIFGTSISSRWTTTGRKYTFIASISPYVNTNDRVLHATSEF